MIVFLFNLNVFLCWCCSLNCTETLSKVNNEIEASRHHGNIFAVVYIGKAKEKSESLQRRNQAVKTSS